MEGYLSLKYVTRTSLSKNIYSYRRGRSEKICASRVKNNIIMKLLINCVTHDKLRLCKVNFAGKCGENTLTNITFLILNIILWKPLRNQNLNWALNHCFASRVESHVHLWYQNMKSTPRGFNVLSAQNGIFDKIYREVPFIYGQTI